MSSRDSPAYPMLLRSKERRSAPRLPLTAPLQLSAAGSTYTASLQDVSRTGISFYLDREIGRPGDLIEFSLEFPPEITLSTSLQVRCKGEIVRGAEVRPN